MQHSPFGLSDIGYHLYTVYPFTKNDILTAIIPIVSMILTFLHRGSLPSLLDIIFHCFGAAVQSHSHLTHNPVDISPFSAVRPSESNQGAKGRQDKQTLEAASCRENLVMQCTASPVAHCTAMPCVLPLYSSQLISSSIEIQFLHIGTMRWTVTRTGC